MADDSMPTIPREAVTPIDYSGYQNLGQSIAQTGQIIDKSLNDFHAFEQAQDKEKLRKQALDDLQKSYPELSKVIPADTPLDELGKKLARVKYAESLYSRAEGKMTLPKKEQLLPAAAMSSDTMFEKFTSDWDKKIQDAEARNQQIEAVKQIKQSQVGLPDNATNEQRRATVLEKASPETPVDAPKTAIDLLGGGKEKDIAALAMQKARLGAYIQGLKDKKQRGDQDFVLKRQLGALAGIKAANTATEAKSKLLLVADQLGATAEGEQAKAEKALAEGQDTAAKEYQSKAKELYMAKTDLVHGIESAGESLESMYEIANALSSRAEDSYEIPAGKQAAAKAKEKPTVSPTASRFTVGKSYRDKSGNVKTYTGANPSNPGAPENWK